MTTVRRWSPTRDENTNIGDPNQSVGSGYLDARDIQTAIARYVRAQNLLYTTSGTATAFVVDSATELANSPEHSSSVVIYVRFHTDVGAGATLRVGGDSGEVLPIYVHLASDGGGRVGAGDLSGGEAYALIRVVDPTNSARYCWAVIGRDTDTVVDEAALRGLISDETTARVAGLAAEEQARVAGLAAEEQARVAAITGIRGLFLEERLITDVGEHTITAPQGARIARIELSGGGGGGSGGGGNTIGEDGEESSITGSGIDSLTAQGGAGGLMATSTAPIIRPHSPSGAAGGQSENRVGLTTNLIGRDGYDGELVIGEIAISAFPLTLSIGGGGGSSGGGAPGANGYCRIIFYT